MAKLTPSRSFTKLDREPPLEASRTHYSAKLRMDPSLRHRTNVHVARPTLLWIDDYEPGLAVYKAIFERFGFNVLTASRGRIGLQLAATNSIDAAIVDYEMPDMNGAAVAASLRIGKPGLPIILFSAHVIVSRRTRQLFDACCDKAGSREELRNTINMLLAKRAESALRSAGHPRPYSHPSGS